MIIKLKKLHPDAKTPTYGSMPHCHEALLPEDFSGGVKTSVSKELARRKRAKGQSNVY